jgi:hypothetical protein
MAFQRDNHYVSCLYLKRFGASPGRVWTYRTLVAHSPHKPPDAPLPDAVASGKEPFIVIAAIAGRMIIRLKSAW